MAEAVTKSRIERALAKGLPAGKPHLMLWDVSPVGLGLKVRSSGSASWIYSYRPKGFGRSVAARTLTLGSWPTVTLDAARTAAQGYAGRVALGQDPAVQLRQNRDQEQRLVSSCITEFEGHMRRRRLVNAKTITSTLTRGLRPLAARSINEITRADVMRLVGKLENAGKPGAAADLRRHTGPCWSGPSPEATVSLTRWPAFAYRERPAPTA